MIQKIKKIINCPNCETKNEVYLWDKINIKINPELKKLILKKTINRLICKKCSYTSRVDIPLFYHDMDKNFLIYFIPDYNVKNENKIINELNSKSKFINEKNKYKNKLRLVFDYETLLEKIKIFDNNLNDRVIEVLKLLGRTHLKLIKGNTFYLSYKKNKLDFIFLKEKNNESFYNFTLPKKMYDDVLEMLKQKNKFNDKNKFEIIDISFAVNAVNYKL